MSDFDIAEMLHDANKFADDNNYVEAAEIYLKITNIDTKIIFKIKIFLLVISKIFSFILYK